MAKSNKTILKTRARLSVNGSLWIECNGERMFGPGPAELLEHIDDTGSILQAAKQMKMSYRKAWRIINHLNENLGKAIVLTQTGGNKGGGSSVSREGKEMINYYRSLRRRYTQFLEKETKNLFS